jgi:hypothetical protein
MNKLLIVGNGFDLAHGLPTSYESFLKHYLISGIKSAMEEKPLLYCEGIFNAYNKYSYSAMFYGDLESVEEVINLDITHGCQRILSENDCPQIPFKFHCTSDFFLRILSKCDVKNWVDIELEYYTLLTDIAQKGYSVELVKKLNSDLRMILLALEDYLNNLPIPEPLQAINMILSSGSYTTKKEGTVQSIISSNTLVLNFNYTNTVRLYKTPYRNSKVSIISIHGKVKDIDYPPIFGFGDERDSNYFHLENYGSNSTLDFVKSFQYLRSNRYDKLLKFIDQPFVVEIMGHSCGLSDRTLLSMIFESDNCKSILAYYHSRGDANNHFELTQNISRHFSSKQMFRNKVLTYPSSAPLPQYTNQTID